MHVKGLLLVFLSFPTNDRFLSVKRNFSYFIVDFRHTLYRFISVSIVGLGQCKFSNPKFHVIIRIQRLCSCSCSCWILL